MKRITNRLTIRTIYKTKSIIKHQIKVTVLTEVKYKINFKSKSLKNLNCSKQKKQQCHKVLLLVY